MADKKNDKNNNKSSKKDNKPDKKPIVAAKPSKQAAPPVNRGPGANIGSAPQGGMAKPATQAGGKPAVQAGKPGAAGAALGGKSNMPVEKKAKDVARHPSGQVKDFKAKTAQNNKKVAEAKRFIANANSQPTSGMAGPQGGKKYKHAQKVIAKARIQNKQALRQGYESPKEMMQVRKADKAAAQQPTRPGATGGTGTQQHGKLIRTPPPRPQPGVVAGTPVTSGIRPTAPVAPAANPAKPAAPAPAPAPPKTGGPPPSTTTAGKGTQAPAVVGNAGAPTSTVTGIQQGGQTAASIAANSAVAAGQRGRGSFRFR